MESSYEKLRVIKKIQQNKTSNHKLVNKQISYQNLPSNQLSIISKSKYKISLFSQMFSVDLDHLNILIMLILAFFSFRAYNTDTLAIEYQPEEEKVEEDQKQCIQDILFEEHQNQESSKMNSQTVQNGQNLQTVPPVEVFEVASENQIDVENVNSDNLQSQLQADQNKLIEVITLQSSLLKFDEESVIANQSEGLEKEEDQESTIVNRIQTRFSQEPCDEEGNVQCSSSSGDSSGDSSVSSQGIYPDLDLDQEKGLNRREKRKQIQKAKRKQKKSLRRQQMEMEKNQVEVIEIQ